jgi:DNA-binding NarL/FixJ family response regulator
MQVVVVEDQKLFQEFLVTLLQNRLGFEIVGKAEEGPEALRIIRETRPQLVILDILIPKLSGIFVAKTILDELPSTKILALSSEGDVKTIHQVHQLHLSGFVDKNEASVELLTEAIQAISSGRRFFSDSLKLTVRNLQADPQSFQKILTRREQEVLTYIGGGHSDAEIGQLMGLSPSSIQSHRRNLFQKLNVHSTPELIQFAQESGFWKAAFNKMKLSKTYHLHD